MERTLTKGRPRFTLRMNRSSMEIDAVPSLQKIVPSPRKFTEDPLCDVRNPRNGAAIFAVPRLNLLCSRVGTSLALSSQLLNQDREHRLSSTVCCDSVW